MGSKFEGTITNVAMPVSDEARWWSVEMKEDGSSGTVGFGLNAEYGVTPKVGDRVTLYCVQGSLIRGVDLNGKRVFYKTDEQLEEEHKAFREKFAAEEAATKARVGKTEKQMREYIRGLVKDAKAEDISPLIKKIMGEEHDYGTVVVAIGQLAAAAARAADREPNGGITGFQASCVFWEFLDAWGIFTPGSPKRLVDYHNMLYPQHGHEFEKLISQKTADWLFKEAQKLLNEATQSTTSSLVHPDVIAHWKAVAEGNLPFGYRVKE